MAKIQIKLDKESRRPDIFLQDGTRIHKLDFIELDDSSEEVQNAIVDRPDVIIKEVNKNLTDNTGTADETFVETKAEKKARLKAEKEANSN